MSDNDLVILKNFQKAVDAHMASSFLKQHGIESFVHDEYVNRIAFYSTGIAGGVKIRLKKKDYQKALDLLSSVEGVSESNQERNENSNESFKLCSFSRMQVLRTLLILLIISIILFYLTTFLISFINK